jgi:hypothetical protein
VDGDRTSRTSRDDDVITGVPMGLTAYIIGAGSMGDKWCSAAKVAGADGCSAHAVD